MVLSIRKAGSRFGNISQKLGLFEKGDGVDSIHQLNWQLMVSADSIKV